MIRRLWHEWDPDWLDVVVGLVVVALILCLLLTLGDDTASCSVRIDSTESR